MGKLDSVCQRIREIPLDRRADWLAAAIKLARTVKDPNEHLLHACLREAVNEFVTAKDASTPYRRAALSGYQSHENEDDEAIDLRAVCREGLAGFCKIKFDIYPPEKPNASRLRYLKQLSEYVRGDLERGEPLDPKSLAVILGASEKYADLEVREKAADELLGILRILVR